MRNQQKKMNEKDEHQENAVFWEPCISRQELLFVSAAGHR